LSIVKARYGKIGSPAHLRQGVDPPTRLQYHRYGKSGFLDRQNCCRKRRTAERRIAFRRAPRRHT